MKLNRNNWNIKDYREFIEYLNNLGESSYKKFSMNLIPDTPNILGIRIPILRKIAKEISVGNAKEFLKLKKGNYHEEAIIHGFVIQELKVEYKEFFCYIKEFADYIYNWAICDYVVLSLKKIKKYKKEFWNNIDIFLNSKNIWHQRFAIVIMLSYYLDDEYIEEVLIKINLIQGNNYYVQMAKAWLIATAFAKQRDITLEYIKHSNMDDITYNMTIRKIKESFRISENDKILVSNLKTK